MNRSFILRSDKDARELWESLKSWKATAEGGNPWTVTVKEAKRSDAQNSVQWPFLAALATQKQWLVNGQLAELTAEEWKDVLTAAFKRETVRIAQGLDGGIVMLGCRTSKFTVVQFSEWIEFLKATCAQLGVAVPSNEEDSEYPLPD